MLYLVTGQPGHGKTLYTINRVEQLRKDSGRTVYYHGIKDLALPWKPLPDPRTWYELPEGSIIVIDECYEVFPKRGSGAATPVHVSKVATNRHQGFDLFLICQHGHNQLDHFVRGLVEEHVHVKRKFGTEKARLTVWPRCANPDISFEMKDAVQSWWSYPRESFAWYKSAEIHTGKRKLPWKMIGLAAGLVLALPLLFYAGFASLVGNAEDAAADAQGELAPGATSSTPGGGSVFSSVGTRYTADSFVPTVASIPFTAPIFSEVSKPKAAPEVAGCGVLKVGHHVSCKCNDQQGNTLDLERTVCMAYFERGAFKPSHGSRYPVIEPYVPPLAPPMGGEATGGQAPSQGADRPALDQQT